MVFPPVSAGRAMNRVTSFASEPLLELAPEENNGSQLEWQQPCRAVPRAKGGQRRGGGRYPDRRRPPVQDQKSTPLACSSVWINTIGNFNTLLFGGLS